MTTDDHDKRMMNEAPGFTVLELLAVVAVIAVLASLLTVSAGRALATARERACAANVRSWGQAFLLYASDHDGYLPHPDGRERNTVPGEYDPKYPEHEQGYVDVLPPYLGERAWRDYPDGQKPAAGVWQCASARPLVDSAYSYRPSVRGYFTYAMNSYLAHDFLFGLPWDTGPQPSFLSLSRCAAPARTILLFEQTLDPAQAYAQGGGLRTAGFFAAEDARALTERHAHAFAGSGGNILHLDGHMTWRNDLWDRKLKNPRVPARGDLTWFPYVY